MSPFFHSSLTELNEDGIMFKFMKKDPVEKAKKHIEKALREIEENFPDYASIEYEKAARLFLEADGADFAVKYFREAAYCALEKSDHVRCADLKIAASEVLLMEGRYDEAGTLYSEASDHQFRMNRNRDSLRSLSLSIMSHLAGRNFETAVNLSRKAEKRVSEAKKSVRAYELAYLCVCVLVEGDDTPASKLKRTISSMKPKTEEEGLISFLTESVKLALKTQVVLEWAGRSAEEINAKTPVEFELRYKCPEPIRVTDYKFTLSNHLVFTKEPDIQPTESSEDSWLFELNPVLSGDGIVGPFRLTLEGSKLLAHKHSNILKFRITKAPSSLKMQLSPEKTSCGIGDEVVFDIDIVNEGDGPADNVLITFELTDGIDVALGGTEKIIQFIGAGERMRFQLYVRGNMQGEENVVVRLKDSRSDVEVTCSASVRVG
jgi:hypothetical protein